MCIRDRYYGYWENGKKHGEGLFTYPNGDTYSGWWKYGKREGKGTYTFAETGMKLVGMWQNGEFTQGRWVIPNGNYFEGEFAKNQPNGQGRWVFQNGNVTQGNYTQAEEERETPEGDRKMEVKLTWNSAGGIVESSEHVNTCEALNY
eukprot:TRINITY_DN12405_c0_g1_i14.p4 TRINITY_DN12405_c0_g1~~TRINITY_DN12405_c0_g1_i14.p4  ORF type:complete len:147 (+),score=44.18 TRINITY_DN12405_c0_g1_i14:86-526(+)